MNIYVYIFALTYIFNPPMYIPKTGIAGLHGNSVYNLWGTDELFSKVAMPFYIPISNGWGFKFLHIFINAHYCPSFLLEPS